VAAADSGPIFIGGTGRSGTSQLNKVLGEHPCIWSSPIESRLIADPGGIPDLLHVLSGDPDPYTSADAIHRFERLVLDQRDFARAVGEARFRAAWIGLLEDLTAFEVQEREVLRRRLRVGRHIERPELARRLASFLDEVFGDPARAAGAERWVEKTPWNILRAPAIFEILPSATLVHAVRNPLDVVASHVEQHWAPTNVPDTVAWLEPVYREWFRLVDGGALAGRRVLQVRMEDLAADWPAQRAALFDSLGLPDHETASRFDAELAGARRSLAADDEALVRDHLGGYVERLGYHS
jgi:omega-hydroxy-beta-dihydromenaquinone-9 sulfotransferase